MKGTLTPKHLWSQNLDLYSATGLEYRSTKRWISALLFASPTLSYVFSDLRLSPHKDLLLFDIQNRSKGCGFFCRFHPHQHYFSQLDAPNITISPCNINHWLVATPLQCYNSLPTNSFEFPAFVFKALQFLVHVFVETDFCNKKTTEGFFFNNAENSEELTGGSL